MGPKKIICMTEESVETLFLLGEEQRIVGVSHYVQRPPQAQEITTISAFTHANISKILSLSPDLVIGFSDIQKEIARELIGRGLNVYISNQRSIAEILEEIYRLSCLVGKREKGLELIEKYQRKLDLQLKQRHKLRPVVYFEEWDDPLIVGIKWVSELIQICGGSSLFADKSQFPMAQERTLHWDQVCQHSFDLFLSCWCGKKMHLESILARPGMHHFPPQDIIEMDPCVFLQPGPALFEAGIEVLSSIFNQWRRRQG